MLTWIDRSTELAHYEQLAAISDPTIQTYRDALDVMCTTTTRIEYNTVNLWHSLQLVQACPVLLIPQ